MGRGPDPMGTWAVARTLREGLGHMGSRRLQSLVRLLELSRRRED